MRNNVALEDSLLIDICRGPIDWVIDAAIIALTQRVRLEPKHEWALPLSQEFTEDPGAIARRRPLEHDGSMPREHSLAARSSTSIFKGNRANAGAPPSHCVKDRHRSAHSQFECEASSSGGEFALNSTFKSYCTHWHQCRFRHQQHGTFHRHQAETLFADPILRQSLDCLFEAATSQIQNEGLRKSCYRN